MLNCSCECCSLSPAVELDSTSRQSEIWGWVVVSVGAEEVIAHLTLDSLRMFFKKWWNLCARRRGDSSR